MRFRLGPIPEDPGFDPLREGWVRLREPGPLAIQVIALPVAFGALVVGVVLLAAAAPSGLGGVLAVFGLPAWAWLLELIAAVPAHEAIHALLHPDGGRSAQTVIGLWPRKAVFYANFEAAMTRNRQLLVLAGPYVALGLLPIGLRALPLGWAPPAAAVLSLLALVGAVLASGDLIGLALLAAQVPAEAVVRNQGWRTYWRAAPGRAGGER